MRRQDRVYSARRNFQVVAGPAAKLYRLRLLDPSLFLNTIASAEIHFTKYTMNANTLKRIEKPLAR
jgi:hypothetical protein